MTELLMLLTLLGIGFFFMNLESKKKNNEAKKDELFKIRNKYFKEKHPEVKLLGNMDGEFAVCIYNSKQGCFEYHFESTRTKANSLLNSYINSENKVCGNVCEFIGFSLSSKEELPHLKYGK